MDSKKAWNMELSSAFATALLLSSSLQILENLIPKIPIFPWLRLGLSHLILLPFVLRFGALYGGVLLLARNLLGFLFGGQVLSGFLISSLSGAFSFWVLGPVILLLWKKKWIGLIGVGILFASTFNLSQLFVVHWLFIQHEGFLFQVSPILVWSVLSGAFVGWGVWHTWDIVEHVFLESRAFWQKPEISQIPNNASKKSYKAVWTLLLGLLFLSLFYPSMYYQGGLFGGLLFRDVLFNRSKGLLKLKWTWPFLFYLVWFHLFSSYGVYLIEGWITKEGLETFLLLSFRMGNAVLLGSMITWLFWKWWEENPELFLSFKQLQPIFYVFPYMPLVFGISVAEGKAHWKKIWKKVPFKVVLESYLQAVLKNLNHQADAKSE